jgi:hypothetical protein
VTLFTEHTIVTEEGQNVIYVRNINTQNKILSYGLPPRFRRTLGDTGVSQDYLVVYLTTMVRQQICCGVESRTLVVTVKNNYRKKLTGLFKVLSRHS